MVLIWFSSHMGPSLGPDVPTSVKTANPIRAGTVGWPWIQVWPGEPEWHSTWAGHRYIRLTRWSRVQTWTSIALVPKTLESHLEILCLSLDSQKLNPNPFQFSVDRNPTAMTISAGKKLNWPIFLLCWGFFTCTGRFSYATFLGCKQANANEKKLKKMKRWQGNSPLFLVHFSPFCLS